MSDIPTVRAAIDRYLNSNGISYALQLDGHWGLGKTHYLNKELIPSLEDTQQSGTESRKYSCRYVSLFGLTNRQQIENAILTTFATDDETSPVKKTIVKAAKSLKTDFGLDETDISVRGGGMVSALLSCSFKMLRNGEIADTVKDTGILFIFDDLERFNGDIIIPISFISQIVEGAGCKCIIICNEEHFIGSNKNSNKKEFHIFKEKIIGRTIRFEPSEEDMIGILEQLVSRFENKYLKEAIHGAFDFYRKYQLVLQSLNKELEDFFSIPERKNIRCLQKVLVLLDDLPQELLKLLAHNPQRTLTWFRDLIDIHTKLLTTDKIKDKLGNANNVKYFEVKRTAQEAQEEYSILDKLVTNGYLTQEQIQTLKLSLYPSRIFEVFYNSGYALTDGYAPQTHYEFITSSTLINWMRVFREDLTNGVKVRPRHLTHLFISCFTSPNSDDLEIAKEALELMWLCKEKGQTQEEIELYGELSKLNIFLELHEYVHYDDIHDVDLRDLLKTYCNEYYGKRIQRYGLTVEEHFKERSELLDDFLKFTDSI